MNQKTIKLLRKNRSQELSGELNKYNFENSVIDNHKFSLIFVKAYNHFSQDFEKDFSWVKEVDDSIKKNLELAIELRGLLSEFHDSSNSKKIELEEDLKELVSKNYKKIISFLSLFSKIYFFEEELLGYVSEGEEGIVYGKRSK